MLPGDVEPWVFVAAVLDFLPAGFLVLGGAYGRGEHLLWLVPFEVLLRIILDNHPEDNKPFRPLLGESRRVNLQFPSLQRKKLAALAGGSGPFQDDFGIEV